MSLDVRLAAYAPNGARMGVLPTPQTVQAAMPFGDVGGIEVAYPKVAPKADLLNGPCEIAVEVSYDSGASWTEPPDSRYLRLVRKGDTVETPELRTYSGPSYVWRLAKARVLPEGLLNEDGKRPFLSATAGTILRTLAQEAQARGALEGMDFSTFDEANDSDGSPWAQVITLYYEPGLDYLTILLNLQAQGLLDFRMEGRSLRVFNADTVMAGASGASLLKGRDLTEAPYTGTLEGLSDFVYLAGDEGASFSRTNVAATKPWGRWENYISQGGVSDEGTMTVLTDSALELSASERVENTYGLVFARAKSLPFRDYGLGQDIDVRDGEGVPVPLRCRQITLTRDEKGLVAGNVVLNDRFLENEVRQSRRVQGITGGSTADGGTGARPAPPIPEFDTLAPKAPTGLAFGTDAYLDDEGKVWATVTVNWVAPTLNTDDTALTDLAGYEVYWRLDGDTTWTLATITDLTLSATTGGYYPNTAYEFAVRALDEAGNRSPFSATGNVVTDDDTVAPGKPSTPTATPYLGVLLIEWDGLLNGGGALPDDFARAEFHVGTTAGFAPSAATLVDQSTAKGAASTVAGGLTYGTAYYAKVVLYDRSGNVSVASDAATATPAKIAATDVGLNAIARTSLIADVRASLGQLYVDDFTTNEWGVALPIEPRSDAKTGPNVGVLTNYKALYGVQRLPYDPAQLYRITIRVRKPVADTNPTVLYAGIKTYDAYGATVGSNAGNMYCVAAAQGIPVGSAWVEYVGYVSGTGADNQSGIGTLFAPRYVIDTTRYIGPLVLANYNAGTGDQVTEIDLFRIEAVPTGQVLSANIADAAIGTAKIADLAVIGAKIANATIGDAKISDLTATKITAGTMSAAITVSGRIATALTGARVEMNSAGLKAYDSGGLLTVDIPSSGAGPTFVGTLRTGFTGARAEIVPNASGATINLYSGMVSETSPGSIYTVLSGTGSAADASLYVVAPQKNSLDQAKLILKSRDADSGADLFSYNYNGSVVWVADETYGQHLFVKTAGNVNAPWLGLKRRGVGEGNTAGASIYNTDGAGYFNEIRLGGPAAGGTIDIDAAQIRLYATDPNAVKVIGNFDVSSGGLIMTDIYGAKRFFGTQDGSGSYVQSNNVYSRAGAGTANVQINSAGTIYRVSSARRYKVAIDYDSEWADGSLIPALRKLRPVTFFDRMAAEAYADALTRVAHGEDFPEDDVQAHSPNIRHLGLIAEDVDEAGPLAELIQYGDEGQIEGLAYDRLAVALLPWLHEIDRRLDALEAAQRPVDSPA